MAGVGMKKYESDFEGIPRKETDKSPRTSPYPLSVQGDITKSLLNILKFGSAF
jgi:hypothetical protein